MTGSEPPVPASSATVILLRETPAAGVEVLFVARHAESRAFAGAHVFPGGMVEPADRDPELLAAIASSIDGARALAALGEAVDADTALSFWIATIRELFEEAGILLAAADGVPVRFDDAAVSRRFSAQRHALIEGTQSFADLVRRERLSLLGDALQYFSRWITPVQAPRRYDARFFVARAPDGQEPLHDARETTSAEWMAPGDALARSAAGTLVLTPPTARTLEELGDLGSCIRILESARARRVVPIIPKVVQIGDRMGVLYPGDVDYERTDPGGSVAADSPGPLNRVIMDDAGWRRFRGLRPD
jgi:8-oxo-dGTP pyrophosphatase MutT (NUDIX family)